MAEQRDEAQGYPVLIPRQHRTYDYLWDEATPIAQRLFDELAQPTRMRTGRLSEIAASTRIPLRTLENWRHHLREDRSWRPEHGHKGKPRKVSPDVEAEAAQLLTSEYIEQHRFCPRHVVTQTIMEVAQSRDEAPSSLGRDYADGFLRRQNLSLRRAHLKRRSTPDDNAVAHFTARLDLVIDQFPPCLVFNVDETCWRLVNGELKTLARTGSTDVTIPVATCPKTDITVIAACSRAGKKLPLRILASGKTPRCTDRYRESPKLRRHFASHALTIDYSLKGWSTSEVMIRYLQWLKDLNDGRFLHVIWDVHASHRHETVQEWASNNSVGLTYIPAGQTDEWQPLDRRVFGSLKRRSVEMANRKLAEGDIDLFDAISILVDAWNAIPEEEILHSWDHIK